jgi:mRNA interferase MazF
MAASYCPRPGDIVWLTFDPQAGHEQAGVRPALVLSPERYSRKVGLALFCPITTQSKGYPFEVALPAGLNVSGVVLSDQVKSLDWKARNARLACRLSSAAFQEVVAKLETLIDAEAK